ncbi:hypothetical protein EYZ11_008815 [Aspergillus tanneri]|uniref:Acyltransferase MbtK/IucB-like conserved domain-containing protein n=1 Tax=Aspergillus tanneri TaxID=1220188 RepID=A0A4S3J9T5_9EURO|nr:uncharacterized protein ATNIH1004_004412 [Aspergillus tanneri]KAA8648527.1 hypothetical protein ATNIH1004_004412 [Aspergillus tanneri]THC91712.1 hypothetical protein EYZ11_008815 [Aspergillus tanneri]
MRHQTCHLPNGQLFTVTPVFGGVMFKSKDAHSTSSILPPGWTIVLSTEHQSGQSTQESGSLEGVADQAQETGQKDAHATQTRFTTPTLRDDNLYISYIVNPSDIDYKPPTSPTRQIAMMLWVTLWWYFHEPEPNPHVQTEASSRTPPTGRPKGDWRIYIKREGIFKGRNLVHKLERMGIIRSEESSVGADPSDQEGWSSMFASRRSFWQLDPRLFLFTLTPQSGQTTPSPSRSSFYLSESPSFSGESLSPYIPTEGPYSSSSHLPTYFPPPPTQYTITNGQRHPIRPKPPHQGEVFYVRYIPSVQQYLSFRVPYLSKDKKNGTGSSPSDLELLHKWMNEPRVNAAWGEGGPISHQEEFLRNNLNNRHSFPVFGCWDGKPFGYFEIYWVKEDRLGPLIGSAGNYDRGIHLLVGEQEFRGAHRVVIWLDALVHYCWLADMRTETVMLEPRVDNAKVIEYLQTSGFYKEGEVTFPHKQSAVMKIKRDSWEAPTV